MKKVTKRTRRVTVNESVNEYTCDGCGSQLDVWEEHSESSFNDCYCEACVSCQCDRHICDKCWHKPPVADMWHRVCKFCLQISKRYEAEYLAAIEEEKRIEIEYQERKDAARAKEREIRIRYYNECVQNSEQS